MGILKGGGYGQYARIPKSWLIKVPEDMPPEQAASIP